MEHRGGEIEEVQTQTEPVENDRPYISLGIFHPRSDTNTQRIHPEVTEIKSINLLSIVHYRCFQR